MRSGRRDPIIIELNLDPIHQGAHPSLSVAVSVLELVNEELAEMRRAITALADQGPLPDPLGLLPTIERLHQQVGQGIAETLTLWECDLRYRTVKAPPV